MSNHRVTPALAAYRLGLLPRLIASLTENPLAGLLPADEAPCDLIVLLEGVRDAARRLSAELPVNTYADLTGLLERETARLREVEVVNRGWATSGEPSYLDVLQSAAGDVPFPDIACFSDIGSERLPWSHWWRLGVALGDCRANLISTTPSAECAWHDLCELVRMVRRLPPGQVGRVPFLQRLVEKSKALPAGCEANMVRRLSVRYGPVLGDGLTSPNGHVASGGDRRPDRLVRDRAV